MSARAIRWTASIALFALVIAGAAWWSASRQASEDPQWLFSQTAHGASLIRNPNGEYTLTLKGIDPHVMAFTDRPARDTQIARTQSLVNSWATIFAEDPPNAVLVEHDPQGEANSVVLTLRNPQLISPTGGTNGDTLTFDAVLITSENPSPFTKLAAGVHKNAPSQFSGVSLFIDNAENPFNTTDGPGANCRCTIPDCQCANIHHYTM